MSAGSRVQSMLSLCALALTLLRSVVCQVVFDGRFLPLALPAAVSWPASQVNASFTGSTSVTAVIRDLTYSSQSEIALLPLGVSLLVEGAGQAGMTSSDGTFRFTIDNLPPAAVSTVSLTKEDESATGSFQIVEFTLDDSPSARFLPASTTPQRKLEFIGDSITVGFGNVGTDASCISKACSGTWCQITSASQGVGPLVASHFGAQSHVTAWSGAGLTRNPAPPAALEARLAYGMMPPNLPEFYPRADGSEPSSLWDYGQYIPQVVVMAIGVNDFLDSSSYPEIDDWTQVYMGAVNALRAAYPGVKIIMVQWPEALLTAYQPGSGSYTQGLDMLAASNYPVYETFHRAAFAKAQAAGLGQVFYFEPSPSVGAFPRGCAGHPSMQGDLAIAQQLIPFISSITGW